MQKSLIVVLLTLLSGCFFRPDEIIPRQNTPVFIAEVKNEYARVYAYDLSMQSMIEIGWIDLKEYEGWTISNFDWATYMKENE